jgi:hypothetical protein
MMRPFVASDLQEVNAWCAAHGRDPLPAERLPPTGAIVPGVACGFLYRTDSAVALLEAFITNPAATLRRRSAAVDEITLALLAQARGSYVMAICTAGGTARRAPRHGFRRHGLAVVLGMEA